MTLSKSECPDSRMLVLRSIPDRSRVAIYVARNLWSRDAQLFESHRPRHARVGSEYTAVNMDWLETQLLCCHASSGISPGLLPTATFRLNPHCRPLLVNSSTIDDSFLKAWNSTLERLRGNGKQIGEPDRQPSAKLSFLECVKPLESSASGFGLQTTAFRRCSSSVQDALAGRSTRYPPVRYRQTSSEAWGCAGGSRSHRDKPVRSMARNADYNSPIARPAIPTPSQSVREMMAAMRDQRFGVPAPVCSSARRCSVK